MNLNKCLVYSIVCTLYGDIRYQCEKFLNISAATTHSIEHNTIYSKK